MHANDLSSRKILDSILSEWKVDKVQIWDMNLEKQHLFASIVFLGNFSKIAYIFFPSVSLNSMNLKLLHYFPPF